MGEVHLIDMKRVFGIPEQQSKSDLKARGWREDCERGEYADELFGVDA